MITWIQIILQKHNKAVFSVLLAVIIVAFVFTIGSSIPFFGDKNAVRAERKDVFGFNFQDHATMRYISRQTEVERILMGIPANKEFSQWMAVRYAFLTNLADSLGMRAVSSEDLLAYMKNLPALQNSDGTLNPSAWQAFADNSGIPQAELERVMMRNAIAAKAERLISGPGFVLDGEVKTEYHYAYGKWNVEIAHLSFDTFNPEITVTEEKLKEYFDANTEAFRVPAAVALNVAFFPAVNSGVEANFSEAEIEKHYRQSATKYVTMENGSYTIKELAIVRDDVIADLKKIKAAHAAFEIADDIATKIYDNSHAKHGSEALNTILAEANVQLKQLPLVRPNDITFPEGIPASVFKLGFTLSEQNFYGDPVLAEDGAWLVFFRESKESFIPEFEDIKAAVERSFKHSEKIRLFAEKGAAASKSITAAVKDGKKFDDAAKAEGLTTSAIDGFSFANEAFHNESMYVYYEILRSELPNMKAGNISPMITRQSGGYIVFASSFEAPSAEASTEILNDFEKFARKQAGENSLNSIFIPIYQKYVRNLDVEME